MRQGVDYSVQSNNWYYFAKQLLAHGRTFVGRYLPYDLSRSSPSKDSRVLTIKEAEILASFGIDIFVWWEDSPTHMRIRTERRALEGKKAGIEDAILANAMVQYFGQPEAPIFFTIDTDTTANAVFPYFEGIESIIGLDRIGAYGGYKPIKGLFDRQMIKYACQTEAWSRFDSKGNMIGRGVPTWDPRAQLHQWTVTRPGYPGYIAGINCDGLDAIAEDFGQWRYGEEKMAIDIVNNPKEVEDARQRLIKRGIISSDVDRHPSGSVVSNGLLFIIVDRIFSMLPEGINLDDYEIQLVKKNK